MEGDAGSGQLNPTPPTSGDDAERSEAEEPVMQTRAGDDAERSEAEEPVMQTRAGDDAERSEAEGPERSEFDDSERSDAEDPALVSSGTGGLLAQAPWFSRVCTALIAAAALVAVGGGLALWGHLRNASADRAEASAVAAAKDCVAATQAPDAKAMASSATKILDCATGDFATQAKIYSGVLVDAYQAANAQVEVTGMRAAVESRNPDGTIDVLVAVRTKLQNNLEDAEEQGYRLRVKMALDGGAYKVARMDQVGQ